MQNILVNFVSALIVNEVYTLSESTTLDILPGQSNVMTFLQQTEKGQTFPHRPVNLPRRLEFRSPVHRSQYLRARKLLRVVIWIKLNITN